MTRAPSIYRGHSRTVEVGLTVEQYHRMIETGILISGDPIELLEGQLVVKNRSAIGADPLSVGTRHSHAIGTLTSFVLPLRKYGSYMRAQLPVTISENSEPEPDGCIVRGKPGDYRDNHPGTKDICCVIEVSESSLSEDRSRKLRIYANACIQQYVIINLVDNTLEEYTEPESGSGRYARVSPFRLGDNIELRTATTPLIVSASEFFA
jgi:Uma2 family endonuclease